MRPGKAFARTNSRRLTCFKKGPCSSRNHAGAAVMEVTGNEQSAVPELVRRRHPAPRSGLRAARMEGAAGRRLERVRKRKAKAGIRDTTAGLGREHGGKQRLGVGMARRAEQRLSLILLDDAAMTATRVAMCSTTARLWLIRM